MKKIILFAVVLVSAVSFAQAKIEFKAKDNTIDYGTVSKDSDDGIRKFEFTNTGNAPLIISNAQSTCGCTVSELSKRAYCSGCFGRNFGEIQYESRSDT